MAALTNRERFHKLMNFEKVDRLPMLEWASWWDLTIDSWVRQGLEIPSARDGLSPLQLLKKAMGLDLDLQVWITPRTARTPTPAHHGAPIVTSLEEYEAILPTLYPQNPIDESVLRAYARHQATGEAIVWLSLDGPFWGPRTLLGIEPHLFAFYDEPELMHRINADLCAYNLRVIEQVCQIVTPDFMTFGEDMSYNNGPMISERFFDEFLLPYYQQMVPRLKAHGIYVFVDSDGDIERALPWFARAGIEGILPLERQAGVDLERLRQRYPRFLFLGHYDKMVMPKGEQAMREEFERLLPVMRQGGFLPSVDHQTPPGVSLENYRIYLKLYAEYVRKACAG